VEAQRAPEVLPALQILRTGLTEAGGPQVQAVPQVQAEALKGLASNDVLIGEAAGRSSTAGFDERALESSGQSRGRRGEKAGLICFSTVRGPPSSRNVSAT
jgi:hypothetical protein